MLPLPRQAARHSLQQAFQMVPYWEAEAFRGSPSDFLWGVNEEGVNDGRRHVLLMVPSAMTPSIFNKTSAPEIEREDLTIHDINPRPTSRESQYTQPEGEENEPGKDETEKKS